MGFHSLPASWRSDHSTFSNGDSSDNDFKLRHPASHLAAVMSCGQTVLMVSVLVASSIGLAWLGFRSSGPSRSLEPADEPGSGIIVRTEVLRLWLPETLIDFAEDRSQSSAPQTPSELRAFLERRGQTDLWYALTARGHQVDGRISDITFIRRPYSDSQHFREVLDVLATAAGDPAQYPTMSYAGAEVHILPRELSEREPREVVEELKSRSFQRLDGSFRQSPALHHTRDH
jgi:hypothetical protein